MGEKLDTPINEDAIVILVMLLVYLAFGAIIEKFNITFGHEAAITIIIGKFKIKLIFYNFCSIRNDHFIGTLCHRPKLSS